MVAIDRIENWGEGHHLLGVCISRRAFKRNSIVRVEKKLKITTSIGVVVVGEGYRFIVFFWYST